MTAGEVAQLVTSFATLAGVVVSSLISLRNASKLDQVHKSTNSLALRNEEIARALGVTEGVKQEREKNT
jgi:hypothetical protein